MHGEVRFNNRIQPTQITDGVSGLYHVFIRDLVIPVSIGIHDHERNISQRVRLNIDLAVHESGGMVKDEYKNVVCYEKITNNVRDLIDRGHVNLVETLAEEISAICLRNSQVCSVKVRVEKLDIMPDAASVGVEIERFSGNG